MLNITTIVSLLTTYGVTETTVKNLIPSVLQEIRRYTNQWFLTSVSMSDDFTIEGNKIYFTEDCPFKVGDWFELLNSIDNYEVYSVKSITDEYIEVNQDLADEEISDTLIKLSFRGVSPMTVSSMLAYDLSRGTSKFIKSQTLNGYSVTYADNSNMKVPNAYPNELYGGVNSLRKVNDDYAEYSRYGYRKKDGNRTIWYRIMNY